MKKLIILIVLAIICGITPLDFFQSQDKTDRFVETMYFNDEITLTPRLTASNGFELQPFAKMEIFESGDINPGLEFTTAAAYWTEITPPETQVELELQFFENGVWSQWLEMDEEEVGADNMGIKKYSLASANTSTSIKYRLRLYGNGDSTPKVSNMEWTFLKYPGNEIKEIAQQEAEMRNQETESELAAFTPFSKSKYISLNVTNAGVIQRKNWGANESLRYVGEADLNTPDLVDLPDDYYDKFSDEVKYQKVVDKDETGKYLVWPLQYPQKVSKIIIHHTATTKNLTNPKQAIRDIYYYHAVSRGWGDIGYNYLMDKNGNIYEGRAGGEGVVGGHAGPGNVGSIGIALIGNYQEEEVPAVVINNLSTFIGKKIKYHNIKALGSSSFRGKIMPNIFGHKDIMSTACPGEKLYSKMQEIRIKANNYAKTSKPEIADNKSGNTNKTTPKTSQNKITTNGGEIRIRLSFSGNPEISSNGLVNIYEGKNKVISLKKDEVAKVNYEDKKYKITIGEKVLYRTDPVRFVPILDTTILQIKNYENRPAWNTALNDNEYRGSLEVINKDNSTFVVNQLTLEDYLKGLGEVGNGDNPDKIKTIIVAARSYAKYYMGTVRKFPGMPYDLDDSPDRCQKYIGYGFEKRAPNVAKAVTDTKGKVMTYNGKVIKAAYFSQSDGTSTKSAKYVWGTEIPYLQSVDDSYCKATAFYGHGVGLSGCGASGMAESGKDFETILKHYFKDIEIKKIY